MNVKKRTPFVATTSTEQPTDRRRQSVKQFGPLEVHTKQFKPREAYRMMARLVESSNGTGQVRDIDMASLDSLMVDMLKLTWAIAPDGPNGTNVKYDFAVADKVDDAFAGRLKLWSEVFGWVVEENFSDFFPDSADENPAPSVTETPE